MSEPDSDNASSLIPYGSRELAAQETTQNRIFGEMVEASLVLAKESLVAHLDLDELVREGERLQRKQGMTPEDIQAFRLFHQAAVAGHAEAQFFLFGCYRDGHGVSEDRNEAVKWLKLSAKAGFLRAVATLGLVYSSGKLVPKDEDEAIRWWKKAADSDRVGFCLHLAEIYKKRSDHAEARRWNKEAALLGYTGSWRDVKRVYEAYDGSERDSVEAYAWLRLFAEYGHSTEDLQRVNTLVARMSPSDIERGIELYQAYDEETVQSRLKSEAECAASAKEYRKAAEQGFAIAQQKLGKCYEHGAGTPEDAGEAVTWYRKAAEQGHVTAQVSLGKCYKRGKGVTKDHAEAAKWYRKAAECGYGRAQYFLAECYQNGEGVAIDLPRAYAWFQLATENRHKAAEIAALMSPSELAVGDQLYEEFEAKLSQKR